MTKKTTKTNKSYKATTTTKAVAPNADLTAMFAAQLTNKFFGPQDPEAYDKPVNIVVAGNGIFRVRKTAVALFKEKIAELNDTSLSMLPSMEEGPELLIPKIDYKWLIKVLSWYKDVNVKDRTEASVLFFWNHNNVAIPTEFEDGKAINGITEEGQLIVYCPIQKNSGTLSDFTGDGMVDWLRKNCTGLLETHSHNTMDAFWSGTDDANENMTQFYGVWGKVMNDQPKFLFRWVSGDTKENIDHSFLFDIPVVTKRVITEYIVPGQEVISEVKEEHAAFQGPWQHEAYPEDWFGQHSKSWAGGTTTYGKGSKGYGRGGYTGSSFGLEDDLYADWYDEGGYQSGYAQKYGRGGKTAATTTNYNRGNTGNGAGNTQSALETPYAQYQKKNLL